MHYRGASQSVVAIVEARRLERVANIFKIDAIVRTKQSDRDGCDGDPIVESRRTGATSLGNRKGKITMSRPPGNNL